MSDLAAFLAARLDEDEHWAHMAEAGWPPENALAASEDPEHYAFMATDITPSKATFIRRHDPARVLREVAAKRAIIGQQTSDHAPIESAYGPTCRTCVEWQDDEGAHEFGIAIPEAWPCRVARALASVYSDHPGYLPEWAA